MNKSLLFLLVCYLFINPELYSQGFIHPGLLHKEEDFERIKSQLAEGHPAVVQGYENLKANEWSQSNVGTWPTETIKRGIAGDENYMNAARGAAAAYQNALRWKISGEQAHADRAVYILNAWASTCTGIHGNTNMSLASGIYGYEFANAAELMRDYEGWERSDFKKFQEFMMRVFYPTAIDFLKRRHDTWGRGFPGHYWANWGLCNALTVMSIGVLCDDVFVYNQGVSFYKYDKVGTFTENRESPVENDGLNEFLGNLVPILYADERGPFGFLGQCQESGRDQGHSTMSMGLAVDISQTGWNQGDDLFAHMDNRLVAGLEYVAAYNSGVDELPWAEYRYRSVGTAAHLAWIQTWNNEHARGQFRPYWDRVIGHYSGIKGIVMPFSEDMSNLVVADAGGSGGTSGGYDHLGYSTLTSTRPAVTTDMAPTTIHSTINYQGETVERGELMNVVPGSALKFIPVLPDGEVDTGIWEWNTGVTGKDLEITADSSGLYRVYYTNSRGITSTQLFSVAVDGDAWPDAYTTFIKVDGEIVNDSTITVPQFSQFELRVESSSRQSTYEWSTGETSPAIFVEVDNTDQIISVVGTNQAGVEVQINFHIKVGNVGPGYTVNNGPIQNGSQVVVLAGQSLELIPVLKPGVEGGTWTWSDGSKDATKGLDNVEASSEISVSYAYEGEVYTVDYQIFVLPFAGAHGYWPMDEDEGNVVHDIWAGKDALMNLGGWTNGMANSCISLMGYSTSYIQLPTGFISSLDDFTIAIWVKPDALESWSRVWDFGRGTDFNMFLTASAEGNNNSFRFAIKAGGAEEQINTSHVLEMGKWSHLTVTRTGNVGVMYLNGEEVGRNPNMTLFPSDLGLTDQNYLGKSQWPDPMFKGAVDELRIYSRALSQSEVEAVKNHALVGTKTEKMVEMDWKFFPNPVKNKLMLELGHGPAAEVEINVMDISGSTRVLEVKQEAQHLIVDMRELPAGIYFIEILSNEARLVKKVVKK
ncbi:LamG-like jellyroll fold domain-containing protein [Geofilum rubicundum]|nr:LamG-like jellyroll fold domain-containing protein [Geofilum rubicundum]